VLLLEEAAVRDGGRSCLSVLGAIAAAERVVLHLLLIVAQLLQALRTTPPHNNRPATPASNLDAIIQRRRL